MMNGSDQFLLKKIVEGLDRSFRPIEFGLVIVAGTIIVLLTFLITFDVISRGLFNAPIQNSYELMALGLVPIVYFGLANVQASGENIVIDGATNWLPLRVRSILDLFGCLLGLVAVGSIVFWGAISGIQDYQTGDYVGSVSQILKWPFRAALVIGAGTLFIRLVIDSLRYLSIVIKPDSEQEATTKGNEKQELLKKDVGDGV